MMHGKEQRQIVREREIKIKQWHMHKHEGEMEWTYNK